MNPICPLLTFFGGREFKLELDLEREGFEITGCLKLQRN